MSEASRVSDWVAHLPGIAESIASRSDEAGYRSAINRAYYAAYLHAGRLVAPVKTRGAEHVHHSDVSAALSTVNKPHGSRLVQLQHLRKLADYKATPESGMYRDWQANWELAARHSLAIVAYAIEQRGSLAD